MLGTAKQVSVTSDEEIDFNEVSRINNSIWISSIDKANVKKQEAKVFSNFKTDISSFCKDPITSKAFVARKQNEGPTTQARCWKRKTLTSSPVEYGHTKAIKIAPTEKGVKKYKTARSLSKNQSSFWSTHSTWQQTLPLNQALKILSRSYNIFRKRAKLGALRLQRNLATNPADQCRKFQLQN